MFMEIPSPQVTQQHIFPCTLNQYDVHSKHTYDLALKYISPHKRFAKSFGSMPPPTGEQKY